MSPIAVLPVLCERTKVCCRLRRRVDGLSNVYDFDEVFLETDGDDDDDESTKGLDDDAHVPPKRWSYSDPTVVDAVAVAVATESSFMAKPPDKRYAPKGMPPPTTTSTMALRP